MDVTPLVRKGQQIIQSYAGGRFKVSGTYYEGAVIVLPEGTEAWDAPDFESLKPKNFDFLARKSQDLDVVLLGCGTEVKFLPNELKNTLKDKGLKVEVMDTGAACRTYNVLMADGRRVAAALLPL